MRIMISGAKRDVEIIAEPFSIEGTDEKFAVHRALPADEYRGDYVATHIDTGFAISHADTIDGAIEEARKIWLSKTPAQIAAAKTAAIAARQARDITGGGAQ